MSQKECKSRDLDYIFWFHYCICRKCEEIKYVGLCGTAAG